LTLPELHLSRPGVAFPEGVVTNADTIRRVRACFKGTEEQFATLAAAIEHVFGLCRTKQRFLETEEQAQAQGDAGKGVADYAVDAAKHCLEVNDVSLDEVDLVVSGGIARQYFEPATAMEIAAKLGLSRTHAFDVTAACVGHLEAVQTAAAYMNMHPHYRAALVCTSELSRHFLSYDIQTVRDLHMKTAGLTVGNAAACMMLRRSPFPRGGLRLTRLATTTVPGHWHLCKVPIDGTLFSSSVELMRLGKLIPPWVKEQLALMNLRANDISYYVFHQPSETMVRKIIEDIGADPEAHGVYTHSLYGNTASASVGVTFDHLLKTKPLARGARIMLGSAAAGFSIVMVAGEWTGAATG